MSHASALVDTLSWRVRATTFICWCVGVGGCGQGVPDEAAYAMRDSAGIAIAESVAPSWSEATEWRRSAEPTVRIGEVDSQDLTALLSSVGSVTRLSDGRIVVLEQGSSEIRWFDSTGHHLASRGRRGRGPGEFNFAAMLVRLSQDSILVEDRPAIKQVLFGPDMTYVGERTLDRARFSEIGRTTECVGRSLPDRSIIACLAGQIEANPRPGHVRNYSTVIRTTWDLDSIYELGRFGGLEQWRVRMDDQYCPDFVESGRCLRSTLHPFYSFGVFTVGGDPVRAAIAENPAYSIEIWTLDGHLERIVRRIGGRRAATPQERADADEYLDRWDGDDPTLLNRFRSEMEVPDSIPAAYDLRLGPSGDLWVYREGFLDAQPSVLYDVFGSRGQFLGEMRFPKGFRIEEVGEDYILGVRTDENEVPFVEMYALDRRRAAG